MLLRFILLSIALGCFGIVDAQKYNPLHPPATYRQADNPQYWKNRSPEASYWQQDVHYNIKVSIDETTDIISGTLELTYWNNSPKALNEAFFHLYQNAFQPDSYLDKLKEEQGSTPVYGTYAQDKKGTEVENVTVDGQNATTELDNTILRIDLPKPLQPGASMVIRMSFKTYFDQVGWGRRMKAYDSYGFRHYNGVHWYPRMAVYDRKFGWTTDQHLGHEFYGDFGTFDVELTFASNFVVGATGFLHNRAEVLPPDLRKKLDVKNFANKPWDEAPSVVTPYEAGKTKTWKYHAENVHDFAFTADPTYRIGEAKWQDVTCYALVPEPHTSGWQDAAQYAADVVEVYSRDFGSYVYHKMIVADARDGMEYPMLTLDGGSSPGYRGLLAHEIGHNWFFGQVGNNEAYRAMLDEGFTQFLTAWSLENLHGDTNTWSRPSNKYVQKFTPPARVRYESAYYGYYFDAVRQSDPQLNTHSDQFVEVLDERGSYRQVYYKTATMLYNLQYVLGDELFQEAIKHYFDSWKIAHPYPEDFRNSIIRFTGVDLNWFFDQWMESEKKIDYAVGPVKKGDTDGQYLVTFHRKGQMQMPLDFRVIDKAGKTHDFHIPNGWFEKKTEATVLPRWIGWGKLQPSYTALIEVPGGIREVMIDPSHRLADVNQLNNSSSLPVRLAFDSQVQSRSDIRYYEAFARPELWYNGYDGLKAGFHLDGHYMAYKHLFDLTVWMNTGVGQQAAFSEEPFAEDYNRLNARFNYSNATDGFLKGSKWEFGARWLDGLAAMNSTFSQLSRNGKSRWLMGIKTMIRPNEADVQYLLDPDSWNADRWNNTFSAGLEHNYQYKRGNGVISLMSRSPFLGSDYNYNYVQLNVVNNNRLGKLDLRTRTFVQYGTGNDWAPESQLYLAGANPEDLMDNKYTRSQGFVPSDWLGYSNSSNNFHAGGGLNLRGYAGYLAPFTDPQDVLRSTFRGTSGAALNAELDFQRLIPIRFRKLSRYVRLETYLFGDAGAINYNNTFESLDFTAIRADAGVGAAFTIHRWGPLQKIKPLTIRVDAPLFLNRPPAGEEFVANRLVFGIQRAF